MSHFQDQIDSCVHWGKVRAICEKAEKRLPTFSEFEREAAHSPRAVVDSAISKAQEGAKRC